MSPAAHPWGYGDRVRLRADPGRSWPVDGIGWGRYGVHPFGPVVTVAGLIHAVHVAELLPAGECAALDSWDALQGVGG